MNEQKKHYLSYYEGLKENELKKVAADHIVIKEHDVYFVLTGEEDILAALVFKNKHSIEYAKQVTYRKDKTNLELKNQYIQNLNNILFYDDELLLPVKSYDEYNRKRYFLVNYYPYREEVVSAFYIGEPDAKQKAVTRKNSGWKYCERGYFYTKSDEIFNTVKETMSFLDNQFMELLANKETFREMITYELFNHEAGITYSSCDALSALGLTNRMLNDEQRAIVKEQLNYVAENTNCW